MPERGEPELGIFSRTFDRPTLPSVLDAVRRQHLGLVHFNFKSAGRAALPSGLSRADCEGVRALVSSAGLRLCGVSGTFNAIHPDRSRRQRETDLARELIGMAPTLGTSLVTLCTGTRDADDMWRWHPENDSPAAWSDLQETLGYLLEAARQADVMLGIEPEHNNVVSSAARARALLDEFQDPHLRVVLDGANLLTAETAERQREVLAEAFELLGPDIAVIHAKDFNDDGDVAAGRGLLDFEWYFGLVVKHRIAAPIVIHEVDEADVGRAVDFVVRQASAAGLEVRLTHADGAKAK